MIKGFPFLTTGSTYKWTIFRLSGNKKRGKNSLYYTCDFLKYSAFYFSTGKWLPVFADPNGKLSVISIAFFLESKNDAVIWRGPKKNGKVGFLFFY